MRATGFLVATFLIGPCKRPSNDGPGPSHPGVSHVDSTLWDAEPFVPGPDDLSFADTTTGSRFNLAGQAYEGPLAEERAQLGQLPAMTAFWFAWSTHHPGARVWNAGVANEGEIIRGSECGVPCDEIVSSCFGGKDCIPAIDDPDWTDADDTDRLAYLTDDDRVLGLARDGRARAYPLDTLWTHEVVNDTWDGWEMSVTYCPLTASGIAVEGVQDGTPMRFGVSGNLWNSNLVLYDRTTDSLYGQIRQVGFAGPNLGYGLETVGVLDTTWGQWRAMFPGTEVLSDTHADEYPYGGYAQDESSTFMANNPEPDARYPLKSYAIGVIGESETVIWAFDELEEQLGEVGFVEDTVGDLPVLVAFDARTQTAAVYSRLIGGEEHAFTP